MILDRVPIPIPGRRSDGVSALHIRKPLPQPFTNGSGTCREINTLGLKTSKINQLVQDLVLGLAIDRPPPPSAVDPAQVDHADPPPIAPALIDGASATTATRGLRHPASCSSSTNCSRTDRTTRRQRPILIESRRPEASSSYTLLRLTLSASATSSGLKRSLSASAVAPL